MNNFTNTHTGTQWTASQVACHTIYSDGSNFKWGKVHHQEHLTCCFMILSKIYPMKFNTLLSGSWYINIILYSFSFLLKNCNSILNHQCYHPYTFWWLLLWGIVQCFRNTHYVCIYTETCVSDKINTALEHPVTSTHWNLFSGSSTLTSVKCSTGNVQNWILVYFHDLGTFKYLNH